MTKPDDYLQKMLFGELKDMDMDVEDICIDFKNTMMVRSNFFEQNYIKIYTGDEDKKYYCNSWKEFKIDVDFLTSFVFSHI